MKRLIVISCLCVCLSQISYGQTKSLVNTHNSSYAKLSSVDLDAVHWTKGFWADRFRVCRDSMIPHLLRTYMDPNVSHAYENFLIAAGKHSGAHSGPPFHDGDFYKLLEGVASMYAITKDKRLDILMDSVIATIAAAQRADGYIHTPVMIAERWQGAKAKAFDDRLNFETYNMGHLMTAACVHYRATGKKNFLAIAIKATDYLNNFYKKASPELARNAICPSHYMGVVEMYRTTKDPAYLALAKNLINIRGLMENGTDDNQDRIPFRQQTVAMGHAVRANYLYAGVADVYAETGEDSLLNRLNLIWDDVTKRKMYITGGCGALYDGTSPNATSYNPAEIQKTHQAYGRDYQLPNLTAHNETCANIGNMLWNWRMLQVTGDAKYADIVETTLYNSILSGISLDGNKFFYTNPLSASTDFPHQLRWSGGRIPYIKLSNCCPPNAVRTMAEVTDYAYSISDKGLWVNLYGANTLRTSLKDGGSLQLTQETGYPWDGAVSLTITEAPAKAFSLFMRVPGWCNSAKLWINGQAQSKPLSSSSYEEIRRTWKKGDIIKLVMQMPATLMEANPLVEETRNQVAVQRGPVVYCLESADLPAGKKLADISLPAGASFQPKRFTIDGAPMMALEGKAESLQSKTWKDKLYQPAATPAGLTTIRLVPYYAWGNRGNGDMSVWLPVSR